MSVSTAPARPAAARSAHPRVLTAGVVVAALLALLGIASTVPYLSVTPLVLVVTSTAVSLGTLVGAVPAARQRPWGVRLVVVTTVLSVLLTAPLFLAPDVPPEVVAPGAVATGASVVALVLLAIGTPRRR